MKRQCRLLLLFLLAVSTFTILSFGVTATSLQFQLEPLIVSSMDDGEPYILQDSANKIWVFFISVGRIDTPGDNRHVFYITSVDRGNTWSDPLLFEPAYIPGLTIIRVVAFQDSVGRMWVAWLNHTAPHNADQIWYSTSDDGENWSSPKMLFGHSDLGAFVEAEGKIWFFFSPLSNSWRVSYITTADGGNSWSDMVPITTETELRNPCATILENGTIFIVFRRYPGTVGYSYSSDGGLTWNYHLFGDSSMDGRPRAMGYGGNIYIFFTRYYEPNVPPYTSDIWLRVWNETYWEFPQQVTNDPQLDCCSCPMCIDNKLWVVFDKGASTTEGYDLWLAKTRLCVGATLDIEPDTLNLKSMGNWITAHIELPEGYSVADINVSTIKLNGTVPAETSPTSIGDYDNDGVPDLMVKFNRTAVSELILSQGIKYGNVTLTVAGRLYDGTMFEGSDVIRVRMPGDVNCDGKVDVKDVLIVLRAFWTLPNCPRWNPLADLNEDGVVDARDLCIVCVNYGKTYT